MPLYGPPSEGGTGGGTATISADADNALTLGSDDGLYVPEPEIPDVEPSADADNALTTGTDGKLYVPTSAGGSAAGEVKSDTTETHTYIGTAPAGTAEGASGWALTRISLASPPVTMYATGTWTGRVAASYAP